MAKNRTDYVNEGRAAYGTGQVACCYSRDGWQYDAWQQGFRAAMRDAAEAKAVQAIKAAPEAAARIIADAQPIDNDESERALVPRDDESTRYGFQPLEDRLRIEDDSYRLSDAVAIVRPKPQAAMRADGAAFAIVRVAAPRVVTGVEDFAGTRRERDAARKTAATIARCRTRVANMIAFAQSKRANRTRRGIDAQTIESANIRRAANNTRR